MDYLISIQDSIDAIYEHEFANWCDKDEVSTILYNLPSAQQWIPVSKRLPKISSARLALRYSNGLVSGGTYLGNKTFDVDFPDCNKKTTVMEWMPLPEPEKGSEME